MADAPAALVTGASRGIGRAIAVELARLGYGVAANYAANAAAADETVAAIAAQGGRAIACQGDVSRAEDRARLIERTLSEFGRLDVLVNNAGVTSPGRLDILDATEANWEQVFGANLKGPFFLSQLAARRMLELVGAGKTPGGKIINISSISAYAVSRNRADYCLSKAALRMLTLLWAERLAEEKIQVFEVCPGVIATDMTAPVKEKYDAMLDAGLAPLGRWGQPADVARAVSALVQDYFPYSTGDCFHVDGGFHIRRL